MRQEYYQGIVHGIWIGGIVSNIIWFIFFRRYHQEALRVIKQQQISIDYFKDVLNSSDGKFGVKK